MVFKINFFKSQILVTEVDFGAGFSVQLPVLSSIEALVCKHVAALLSLLRNQLPEMKRERERECV